MQSALCRETGEQTSACCVAVTDFGAIGDGVTDAAEAFEAANAAAWGRRVYVPAGVFHLSRQIILDAPVRFVGHLRMPEHAPLILRRNFDLKTYIAAFGDAELGFRKALQALFYDGGHVSLDMRGRRVRLSGPVDVARLVQARSSFASPRTLRNGALQVGPRTKWRARITPSVLDFSGFAALNDFRIVDMVFDCAGRSNAVRFPNHAVNCQMQDCLIRDPAQTPKTCAKAPA